MCGINQYQWIGIEDLSMFDVRDGNQVVCPAQGFISGIHMTFATKVEVEGG